MGDPLINRDGLGGRPLAHQPCAVAPSHTEGEGRQNWEEQEDADVRGEYEEQEAQEGQEERDELEEQGEQ